MCHGHQRRLDDVTVVVLRRFRGHHTHFGEMPGRQAPRARSLAAAHLLLSTVRPGPAGVSGNPGETEATGRGRMNAIRAIHSERHEGIWVFDEGRRSAISGQLSAEARGAGRRLPGVLPHDSTEPRRARARTPPRQGALVGPLRGERLDTLLPCSRRPVQVFVVVTDRFLSEVGFPGKDHRLAPLLSGDFLHGSQVSPAGDHREFAQGPRKQAVGARGHRGPSALLPGVRLSPVFPLDTRRRPAGYSQPTHEEASREPWHPEVSPAGPPPAGSRPRDRVLSCRAPEKQIPITPIPITYRREVCITWTPHGSAGLAETIPFPLRFELLANGLF